MENAKVVTRSWWYYAGFGVLVGVAMTAFLLLSGWWRSVAFLLVIVGGLIFDRVSNRMMPDAGSRPMRMTYVFFWAAVAIVLVGIGAGSWFLLTEQGLTWIAWIAGLVTLGFVTGTGYLWERFR